MTPAQQRSADSLPKRVITKRNCEEVLLPTMVRHPARPTQGLDDDGVYLEKVTSALSRHFLTFISNHSFRVLVKRRGDQSEIFSSLCSDGNHQFSNEPRAASQSSPEMTVIRFLEQPSASASHQPAGDCSAWCLLAQYINKDRNKLWNRVGQWAPEYHQKHQTPKMFLVSFSS